MPEHPANQVERGYYAVIASVLLLGGATLLYAYFSRKHPHLGVTTLPRR